jgi:hypothetical protein
MYIYIWVPNGYHRKIKFVCAIYGGSEPGDPQNNHPRGGSYFENSPLLGALPYYTYKFSYRLRSIDFWTYQFGPSVEYFKISYLLVSSWYTGYFSNLGWYATGIYYIPGGYMGRYMSRYIVHYTWYEIGVPNSTWLYIPHKVPCYPCWWLIPVLRPGTCFTHIKALHGRGALP